MMTDSAYHVEARHGYARWKIKFDEQTYQDITTFQVVQVELVISLIYARNFCVIS